MLQATVLPDLVLTTQLHARIVAVLFRRAPDLSLSWEDFIDPARWTRIPDRNGKPYKIEFELIREEERVVKINYWLEPDLRAGDGPLPHNHPWVFMAEVLDGYTEQRWWLEGDQVKTLTCVYRPGDLNHMPTHQYHEVTALAKKGAVSVMFCGKGEQNWGYLDVTTPDLTAGQRSTPHQEHPSHANFKRHKDGLNRHKK